MSSKPISVLITGANRGIGLEMVKQMVETQGPLSVVFACCRDPDGPRAEGLQDLAKKHPDIIKIITLDVADHKTIKKAAEQVGSVVGNAGLNLLINNAAMATYSAFFKSTPEEMYTCFNTNVVGPMVIIQEFMPLLRLAAKDSGLPGMSWRKAAVINISTIISSIEMGRELYKRFNVLPYPVSKAALNMMSVCASVELEKDGILCMLLHPGWVRTDMGGPDAEIDVHESVDGMLGVMKSLTEKHIGVLLNWKGETIPW